jgi:hypothetical protein
VTALPRVTTYDLTREARSLVAEVMDATDLEVTDLETLLGARIDAYLGAAPDKVEASYHVCQRVKAEAEVIKAEVDRLRGAFQALQRIEGAIRVRTEGLLEAHEALTGEARMDGATVSATLAASPPALVVDDEQALIDAGFVTVAPDKARAKEAIGRGEAVPGARLVRGRHLRWARARR